MMTNGAESLPNPGDLNVFMNRFELFFARGNLEGPGAVRFSVGMITDVTLVTHTSFTIFTEFELISRAKA